MVDSTPSTDSADDREMLGATGQGRGGAENHPRDWVTGDEPMTDSQRSNLDTLARDRGEQVPADLTKAQASEAIDRLQGSGSRDPQGDTGSS